VSEGERYQVSSVKLAGDFAISEEELTKLVTVKAGDVFSREKLNESTKAISDRLGKEGYAFANVNAAPDIDKEKRQVAFTVFVDPGKRVYVRRINVSGNAKTRDEVIRRELRQMEGAWYDAERVTASKRRLDRLGYFTETAVETPPVQGTGALALGAGFSSTEGIVLSGSISQANFMGSGNNVAIAVNTGKINTVYSFSYTNPYFTTDGISQGFDVYYRTIDTSRTSLAPYKTNSMGGNIRFGIPIGEKQSLTFGAGVDLTEIETFSDSPLRYQQFVQEYPGQNLTIPFTAAWISDGKDSFLLPTDGWFQKASVEVAIPGGDLTFYRATYQLQRFVPVSRQFTLMFNGEIGYADSYGDTGTLPFYKNFYAGGVNTVRGYKAGSLGPVDVNGDRVGGTQRVLGNAELLWNVPGMEKSLRLGLFIDAGQVFGTGFVDGTFVQNQSIDLGQLRYSTGLSAAWISPLGPLKFSIAQPINEEDGDRTEVFQFQLGTTF
jgi:outer membrane protein insertion porin family